MHSFNGLEFYYSYFASCTRCNYCQFIYKKIPELKGIDVSLEDATDVIKKILVSRFHDIAFKKIILANGEQELTVDINFDKAINLPKKGLVFFRISYNICNGSFIGKVTAAYNVNNSAYYNVK